MDQDAPVVARADGQGRVLVVVRGTAAHVTIAGPRRALPPGLLCEPVEDYLKGRLRHCRPPEPSPPPPQPGASTRLETVLHYSSSLPFFSRPARCSSTGPVAFWGWVRSRGPAGPGTPGSRAARVPNGPP